MINPQHARPFPVQAHLVLETNFNFRLILHWTRLKVLSSCSAVISSMLSCGCCSAALFTKTSSLPNSFTVCSTAFRQNSSPPASPAIKRQRPRFSSTSRLVSSASSCSLRYTMAMSAPSFAKAIATARPIPLSPPVIMAALPSSFPLPRCFESWETGLRSISDSCPGRFGCECS